MSKKQPDKSKPKTTSKPDELIKEGTVELTEEELKRVTGGAGNTAGHEKWIEISSF